MATIPTGALLVALVAWFRARCGAVLDVVERALFPPRLRGASRAATDSQTIVATGAGVAASGGLAALLKDHLLGGAIYALSLEVVDFIGAVGSFGRVFTAFGGSIADLVASAIPAEIVDAGVFASATAIRTQFGVSGFLIAIVVTMLGVGLFLWFLANIDWTPTKIFFGGRE